MLALRPGEGKPLCPHQVLASAQINDPTAAAPSSTVTLGLLVSRDHPYIRLTLSRQSSKGHPKVVPLYQSNWVMSLATSAQTGLLRIGPCQSCHSWVPKG